MSLQPLRHTLSHQRVLSHRDGSLASQRRSDVRELLGSDVIGVNDEARGVRIEKLSELREVLNFSLLVDHFIF